MNKQEIFNLCSQERLDYLFIEAWIKIVDLTIEDVEWTSTKLGNYDEKDLINEIKEIEIPLDDLEDGYYILKCLFSVDWDCDDYRSWTYLNPEIFEFDFQISLEDAIKQQERFDALNIDPDPFEDLFKTKEEYIGLVREDFSQSDEWKIGYRLNSGDLDKMKEWKNEMLSCSDIEDCKIFKVEEIK